MNKQEKGKKFWLGNAVLALAMVVLLALDPLSELIGIGAMVLWIVLVIAGVYFLMSEKNDTPNFPG